MPDAIGQVSRGKKYYVVRIYTVLTEKGKKEKRGRKPFLMTQRFSLLRGLRCQD